MRAYERFLDYAKIYTTSDDHSTSHPSTARQFDLARMLVDELHALGVEDAMVDEHCYVYGSLPATPGCEHWVTTSRRTSPQAEAVLAEFPFDYALLFSQDRFNPIPAFVTQCERLFVTADSTGMLSEAVAVGHANVEVLDNLTVATGKFARFVDNLCAEDYAHRFDGALGNARRKVNLAPTLAALRDRLGL